jgi:hypothetical protein
MATYVAKNSNSKLMCVTSSHSTKKESESICTKILEGDRKNEKATDDIFFSWWEWG